MLWSWRAIMPPRSIYGHLASALADDWALKARPEQLQPPGDWWSVWLLLAGRGFGKTRAGTGWVRNQKLAGCSRIALLAPTAADCRDVLVEGPSGILATSPNHDRPIYESSKRRLVWSNGAIAATYSAEEAERLRGPEHDAAYCDELGGGLIRAFGTCSCSGFGLGLIRALALLPLPNPRN